MRLALVITIFVTIGITASAQTESREQVLRQIESKRAELTALEDKLLAPSEEDLSSYAEFLKQPDTGLIRLLPREDYDSYVKDKKTLTLRGGGAFYSFATSTHEYGGGNEIGLERGYINAMLGGASYGAITKLDGARLEDVSTELPAVMFIARYNAVTTEPEARVEQRRFRDGTTIGGLAYKASVPAEVGAVYMLRSVDYDRSDLLVAFRIVRKDTDGSVIIAWKLLKKYPKPELARAVQSSN